MTTQALIRKLNREIGILREDVREIKKMVLAPLKDSEGDYQPEFVKKILSRAQSSGPFYEFTDKESFLKHVRSSRK